MSWKLKSPELEEVNREKQYYTIQLTRTRIVKIADGKAVVDLPRPTMRARALLQEINLDFEKDPLAVAKLIHILESGTDGAEIGRIAAGLFPEDIFDRYLGGAPVNYDVDVAMAWRDFIQALNDEAKIKVIDAVTSAPPSIQAVIASLISMGIGYKDAMGMTLEEATAIINGQKEVNDRIQAQIEADRKKAK